MDLKVVGMAAALGSAASWAAGSILFKRLGDKVSPFGLTLSKGAVSVVLLGLALMVAGVGPMSSRALLLLAASGLLGIAVGDTLFFAALRDLGPITLVVFFMLGQIITALFGVAFNNEHPSLQGWAGILLTIIGIGIVLSPKLGGETDETRTSVRGLVLGGLFMLCMAISTLIAKKAFDEEKVTEITGIKGAWLAVAAVIWPSFVRMAAGTCGMFGYGLAARKVGDWLVPFRDGRTFALLVVSVCVVTFGGFWLTLVALKLLPITTANTLSATEPIFVLPLAAIVLKQQVTFREVMGTALSVSGVILLCRS